MTCSETCIGLRDDYYCVGCTAQLPSHESVVHNKTHSMCAGNYGRAPKDTRLHSCAVTEASVRDARGSLEPLLRVERRANRLKVAKLLRSSPSVENVQSRSPFARPTMRNPKPKKEE